MVDGCSPRPHRARDGLRQSADDPARAARGLGGVGAGARARPEDVSPDRRTGGADRADVDPVSRWLALAGDDTGGGAEAERLRGGSWTRPTSPVRLAGSGWRASGGGVRLAVADRVEHAGNRRIAGGVAAGWASAAAAVPGAGGGVARIAPNLDACGSGAPDPQASEAAGAGAVPHSIAARRAGGGTEGGFRKGSLSRGVERLR